MHRPDPTPASRAVGLRAAFWLLVVHGVAFTWVELGTVREARPQWQVAFAAFAFIPLQVGSSVAMWLASRREALLDSTRRALRYLAAGYGMVVLGSVVWFAMYLRGTPLPYISWADLIYFQYYPLLVVALLSLPVTQRSERSLRDVLGWLVVAIAFGSLIVFTWQVESAKIWFSAPQRLIILLSSTAQLVTLVAINRALERARRLPSRRAMMLLLSSLAVSVVGDLVFQFLFSTAYEGRNWNLLIAVLVNLATVYSAVLFLEDDTSAQSADERALAYFSPLPVMAVSAMALMLVWMSSVGQARNLGALVAGLVLLNVMLVGRDVLTSRATAAALQTDAQRDAAMRLDALVRNASDAILLVDDGGTLRFASSPADRIFGVPLAGRLGRQLEELIPADGREAWRAFLADVRAHAGRPTTYTWRLPRLGGEERLIETIGLDLRDEPAVRGTVLNLRDVTERASLEERLRQAQKLEVAGQLAGGVAHDFNNVLTTVIAGTELARLSIPPEHQAQEDLDSIRHAAQRGAALTRRLLAFVRQEPVPAQRVDVAETLRELEPLLARLVGGAHTVELHIEGTHGTVEVDRNELDHIIFNLVANARDAMPVGGAIKIGLEEQQLAAEPSDAGYWVIRPPSGRFSAITITDSGVGMTDDVRHRMFDPFYTQKKVGRGTGLGLIGVRPLVEGAGGGLRVDTQLGKGTRVTLLLPMTGPPTPHRTGPVRPSPVSVAAVRREPVRILLVEDELAVREQLVRLLEAIGYAAQPVASTAEARAVLARDAHGIRIVLSDVMMPGETGLGFASWLRTEHPSLPILLISGHTGTALDREARLSDDLQLLRKPFSGAELGERLSALLNTAPR